VLQDAAGEDRGVALVFPEVIVAEVRENQAGGDQRQYDG